MSQGFRPSTLLCLAVATTLLASRAHGETTPAPAPAVKPDANLPLTCTDRRPPPVDPGSYGMQLDGSFRHPAASPLNEGDPIGFAGRLEDFELNSYVSGVKVEAAYEGKQFTPDPFHSWQNIVDFKGRRYLFQYDRSESRVYDITDVRNVRVVESLTRDDANAPWGVNDETFASKDWQPYDIWGASSIQWNERLREYVMVQSFEQKRQIPDLGDEAGKDKFGNPAGVASLRASPQLKGFKVFALKGPRRADWKLLATVSTDDTQRDPLAPAAGPQQGSGSIDVPYYTGQKYMFIAVAPNDTYANTEYPNYLYSPAHQAWDMSDPAHPKLLDTWHRAGQVKGEDEAYAANPRCGNRTSWMGARMPMFVPRPVEEGGKLAFAAVGGFGVSAIDISDPSNLREIGHLDLPPSFAGTEGDNIDVSQYESTGMIYVSGYPLNEDCYEPYKDIFQVDARDPAHLRIVGALPRPKPPATAGFTDFCQRRGSFGPKRSGYYTSPGDPPAGLLVYAFYNAGVQIFDVRDPAHPRIAAYFVPKTHGTDTPDYAYGNQTHGVYVEWDRKIIWTFNNHGIYALSAEALIGAPNLGAPAEPFRNSAR